MLTVRDELQNRVNSSPYLREALAKGLINMSSLARELRPQIARGLKKDVSIPAVLMALKRYSDELRYNPPSDDSGEQLGNLSLRTNLVQLTVANSERLMPILGEILLRSRNQQSSFSIFTRSAYETSLVVSTGLQHAVEEWLANERITRQLQPVNAISLQRLHPRPNTSTSGALHVPIQALAWQGIQVIDVSSTSNEIILIMQEQDIDLAISTLRTTLRAAASHVGERRT